MKKLELFQAANHYCDQTLYCCGKNGEGWLPDAVVKLEEVGKVWPILQVKVKHDLGVELPNFPIYNERQNPVRNLNYKKMYCKRSVRMVAKRYAKDIKLLGYKGPPKDYRIHG
jgi:hypothetical protein